MNDVDSSVHASISPEPTTCAQPEVEHVCAGLGGPADHGLGHRGRGDAHVVPDGDPLRLEHLYERAADGVRTVLVEVRRVDPAHVVGLEDLGVEHARIVAA